MRSNDLVKVLGKLIDVVVAGLLPMELRILASSWLS